MENKNEKLQMFLKELAELTDKYGFIINGCGCCGSPWIEDITGTEVLRYLTYNLIKREYS